jgi:hypothetical protein
VPGLANPETGVLQCNTARSAPEFDQLQRSHLRPDGNVFARGKVEHSVGSKVTGWTPKLRDVERRLRGGQSHGLHLPRHQGQSPDREEAA